LHQTFPAYRHLITGGSVISELDRGRAATKNKRKNKKKELSMNKDRVEGKVKDLAGRVERQAGEWTGDPEKQVEGAAKQAAGKVQNAWGKTKDAAKDVTDTTASKRPQRDSDDTETEESINTRRSGS
jgi:uncharacterized protein YjbJ (UPF0337 family)